MKDLKTSRLRTFATGSPASQELYAFSLRSNAIIYYEPLVCRYLWYCQIVIAINKMVVCLLINYLLTELQIYLLTPLLTYLCIFACLFVY